MLITSIIIFAVAAVLGVIIIAALLKDKPTPKPAVFAHGALAAVALVILIIFAVNNPEHSPVLSIALFAIAALGGFVLFAKDMSKKPGPKALAVIHALAAVVGFLILLAFAFA